MKVSLVGAGPGDPGLMTMRGLQLLREADVIIYDALINKSLLKFAKKGAELIYAGKVAGKHALPQDEINALLAKSALEKGDVVRLKGGDPYIFGRGGEEAEYLAEKGIPFEVVPGVSSAVAAPAYAGVPLSHRDLCSAITIVTGHENPGKDSSALNWNSLAQSGATLVFVMGMKNLPGISRNLIEAGMPSETPGAVIYRGTTPRQREVFAPLSMLPEAAQAAGLSNPAVIVVGKVCGLRSTLNWVKNKPLLGRGIAVTRAREQASEMASLLAEAGADVVEFPSLEIRALEEYSQADGAIARLEDYAWIVFTSVNGVRHFWERLRAAGKDSRALAAAKIAAIGPATAEALAEKGISPDLIPASYVAENVAEAILEAEGADIGGKRILIPRAAQARMVLPDTLARAGAIVDVAPVYESRPVQTDATEIIEKIKNGEIDCVSFGSSSTVSNFLSLVPADLLRGPSAPALAAIGPITAERLRESGLQANIEPESFTIPALVEAIEKHFSKKADN